MDHGTRYHPLPIDVNPLHDTVTWSMAFKGKQAEHRAAVTRVGEVVDGAVTNYRKAMTEGTPTAT